MHTAWKRKITFVVILAMLCTIALFPLQCHAETVWSDDFDDSNYDGWTVTTGSFSIEDNALQSTSNWSIAIHNNSVTTGTWSFDVFVESDGRPNSFDCGIYLIIGDYAFPASGQFSDFVNFYALFISEDLIFLERGDTSIEQYSSSTLLEGWLHFIITRDSTGYFSVFLNNYFIMSEQDTDYASSSYFGFWSRNGSMLDNIIVSDTIDYAQQWYDLGPLTPLNYLQLAISVLLILMSIYMLIKRPKLNKEKYPNSWWWPHAGLVFTGVILLFSMTIVNDRAGIIFALSEILVFSTFLIVGRLQQSKDQSQSEMPELVDV